MNPAFANAPPNMYGPGQTQGYGQPPGAGMQPPVQPNQMFNGTSVAQRPTGPGGFPSGPMKPGAPIQNGPSGPAVGAQGEPTPIRAPMGGRPPGPMGGGPGMRPPGPHGQQQPMIGPNPNQLSGQMGGMNISGPRPGQGLTPPSGLGMPNQHVNSTGMPGQPPDSIGMPGQHPNSMGMAGHPPNSRMPGQPPNSMGIPGQTQNNIGMYGHQPGSMGMQGNPSSIAGPPPRPGQPWQAQQTGGIRPSGPPTMGGFPPGPPTMGGPPRGPLEPPHSMVGGSMGVPPVSGQPGMLPQTSIQGPPAGGAGAPHMAGPTSQLGPQLSTSYGGFPPTSMPGMPNSMAGGPVPPPQGLNSMSNQPPSSMAGPYTGTVPPPGPPPIGGQHPTPPDTPGGQFGNYGAPAQGFAGPPSGPGGIAGQPQQQPRRLDPDQMPSPIQVIEDDKTAKGGLYQTNQRGVAPPLVTTNFICEDQGNANPRFMRSTAYNIPITADMCKQSHIPIALAITPFARLHDRENPPPLVDFGQLGPVRCKRCKAYISPYMMFIDGGRRFQCNFCTAATDVAPEYFAHLDHTGRRVDAYDRPELCLGSYELVATADYCRNNTLPQAPAFIFMIDVSYNSVKSGLVHLLCNRLKEDVLVNLPKETGASESEIRVGFVTYHRELHFYNVKGNLAQPQMLVVSDVQDVFVPLLDGFLVKLSESEAVIDSLLAQIPEKFAETRETEIVLGPVIQAGLDALKAAEISGKLLIFHSSLPIKEAPGKLKNRDDRKLLGSDKEKTILTPQNNFYTKLGQECVAAGCSVDLFLFNNSYIDVATIAEVPRMTSGNIFKYQYFQADLDGNRLMEDLKLHVSKPIAFDAIMRVRTSTGIRPTEFLGNFYMSNTTDVELATVDCDKTIGVEIKHDDKLSEADGAYVQAAVLYTSVSGQRRLRIHNLAFNCCSQIADLFRSCELDTVINILSKYAIRDTLQKNPKDVREALMTQCSHILSCYRKNCASPSSAGQLILPEGMKLLPLYTNCIIKSNAFQGASEISTDDKSYLMFLVNAMTVKASNAFFYPRLLPLHDLENEKTTLPTALRCSMERLQENGVYVLENGQQMFLWVGHNVDPKWVQDVFGVQSFAQIDIDKCQILDFDNQTSQKVRGAIKRMRDQRHRHMKLMIVRQRDKLEPMFHQFLVEDRGANGTASYVDFLCHIHKEIRSLLS